MPKTSAKTTARKGAASQEGMAYQGRKAARAGSEQRRRAILEAALRIIVRDGVRAVRHRAVAAEAQVPLSATTYYFKDIHDLIADAFTLFVENTMAQQINPVWVRINEYAGQYGGRLPAEPARRAEFAAGMGRLCADYIEDELRNHRDHLLAEQAFLQAAIADPRLREPALAFRRSVVDAIVEFFVRLGTAAPAPDAELVYSTFMQLEYEHLLKEPGLVDRARIESVIGHHFALVFR